MNHRLDVDPGTMRQKRLVDLLLAGLAVLALMPLLIAIVLFIKLVSPGPALFRQERIGQHGKPFHILKFRTMHPSPPRDATATVTVRHDPRLIRGGAILRKYKLDELPQLFNVLMGSMSLVGPRPTVKSDIDRMTGSQKDRLLVPPGLTGLAQLNGNTSLSWPRRIEYDRQYIARVSVLFDITLLLKTAAGVISGRTDTHPNNADEWLDHPQ